VTPEPQPKRVEPPLNLTQPDPPKNARRLWIVAGLLSLLALGGFVRSRRAPAPVAVAASDAAPADKAAEPVPVEVATVALRPLETLVSAKGTLVPAQGASARVAVTAPGRLTRVLVAEGDRVAAGQLLALVDNRSARAASRGAQAALSASQSDAQSAILSIRAAQSDQTNALRQAQLGLSSASTERDSAVRAAQVALRSAQSDLRKTQVGARARDVSNALQQARLALRSARIDREASVKAARNALRAAQTDLTKLQAGARPQEIRQAQAAVSQAQATRDRAATEVGRVQFLVDRGIKARRELDDAQTALRVAEANLQSAKDALSLVQAGTRIEDIRAGELRVAGAREALQSAGQSGDAKVGLAQAALGLAQSNLGLAAQQRPEDVRAAALRVQSARDAVRQAQQNGDAKIAGARAAFQAASRGAVNIAAKAQDARSKQALAASKQADLLGAQIAASSSELRAPLSGIVSKRSLNPGDMADPATPVVEISDASTLNLLANLSGDGANVQQGMTARVSTAAMPGRSVPGRVVSVGQIDPQTNLLSVRVAVPNPNGQLKVGAFASADIVLATKPLAVVVPRSALLTRDGKSAVLVAGSDGKAHQKTVTTGIERGGSVEIPSGLKAGERVISVGGYQLDDGAPIKVAPPGTLGGEGATGTSGAGANEAGGGQGAAGTSGTNQAGASSQAGTIQSGAGSSQSGAETTQSGAGITQSNRGAAGTSGTNQAGVALGAGGAPGT